MRRHKKKNPILLLKTIHNYHLVPKPKNLLLANYFYQVNPNNFESHARATTAEKDPFILSLQQNLDKC